jgi:hypothetical protein
MLLTFDQSRPISLPPPITLSPALVSTTFGSGLRHISKWWCIRAGRAWLPIVDVPFAQGKEVTQLVFSLPSKPHTFVCSATQQQVILRVTAATDVMKTLILPVLRLHQTQIHDNHPQKYRQRSECMEGTGYAAASTISRIFSVNCCHSHPTNPQQTLPMCRSVLLAYYTGPSLLTSRSQMRVQDHISMSIRAPVC